MALRTNTLQSPAYTSTAASSSSLVTPSLTLLADPPIRLADGAALDYLMIEMVGVLRESAGVANERVRRVEREMKEAGEDVRYDACGSEMVCTRSNNKVSTFGNAS